MNGAESLAKTLADNAIEVCFANPGTSEMHFVSALDGNPRIRSILCLFEGVATGAADGYYRITGKPAATLLHLGPGLGNGLANLHNAKKARSGILNVVGEHATDHLQYESPLRSDTSAIAAPVSNAVITAGTSEAVADCAVAAIEHTRAGTQGAIATLILPADTAWGPGQNASRSAGWASPEPVSDAVIEQVAGQLRALGKRATLLLGRMGASEVGQRAALRIQAATGCQVMLEFYNARLPIGQGRPNFPRIPYVVDAAVASLAGCECLILAGAVDPIAFFAYPGKPSRLAPTDCRLEVLGAPQQDLEAALLGLAQALDAPAASRLAMPSLAVPTVSHQWGATAIAQCVARALPENAIVVDETVSSGRAFAPHMAQAQPHDWLGLMGGAIGFGLPAGLGAAVAAPDRQVVVLQADGSAMYTLQALWSMARESLPVVVIVFANRAYEILKSEFKGVQAQTFGETARQLLSLDSPALQWVEIARGLGVNAESVASVDSFAQALQRGLSSREPYLIEALI